MELSPQAKTRLRRLEKLFLCFLFQVIVPALPFAPQLVAYKGHVPDAVLATGSAMYVLGMAGSCKNKSAFSLGLVCGILLIVLYGIDAAKVDKTVLLSDPVLPPIVMLIVGTAFFFDRCYYHLFKGEGFGPWEGDQT